MIKLGDKVKHKVSGYTGIVTGHCTYLYNTENFGVTAEIGADGNLQNTHWFEEKALEKIEG